MLNKYIISISGASPLSLSNQNSTCNPHSTTSPGLINSSQLTPTHILDTENNNKDVDDSYENDNISVTGSPALANSTGEDDDRRSASPPPINIGTSSSGTGAFTSLIQCHSGSNEKNELLGEFQSHIQTQPNHQHALNHALAAHLFLQSPLMPQPSQWLYSQLYNNYSDLPWFRNTLQSSSNNNNGGGGGGSNAFRLPTATNGLNGANINELDETNPRSSLNLDKRSVTLISHKQNNGEMAKCLSPPVSSTKRTPSPDDEIEIVAVNKKSSDHLGPIKNRSSKNAYVWRPY